MRKEKIIYSNRIETAKREKGVNGKNKKAGNFSFRKVKEDKSKKAED